MILLFAVSIFIFFQGICVGILIDYWQFKTGVAKAKTKNLEHTVRVINEVLEGRNDRRG